MFMFNDGRFAGGLSTGLLIASTIGQGECQDIEVNILVSPIVFVICHIEVT